MASVEQKLAVADKVKMVGEFLTLGIQEDFISRPEAAGIFKDILRDTGFKAKVEVKPETAPKKEEVK